MRDGTLDFGSITFFGNFKFVNTVGSRVLVECDVLHVELGEGLGLVGVSE